MATEYVDGTMGKTKSFTEALGEFLESCEVGTAKAFYVGTEAEIEERRKEKDLQSQIDMLDEKVKDLESIKGGGLIEMPTPQEIKAIKGSLDLIFGKEES